MKPDLNIAAALSVAALASGADDRARKKNFAEKLSRELAQVVADALRSRFQGITPSSDGKGHERPTRTAKGVKKLDINYSTPDLGLGLGVSIKTVTASDPKTKRFTKNFTRIDNELRAEAKDYHQRQPYAVMAAIVFLPETACRDGTGAAPSSFGASIQAFRHRSGRQWPRDEEELFEAVFVACYRDTEPQLGDVWFFSVDTAPPRQGLPIVEDRLTFGEVLAKITDIYEQRNDPPFAWAERGK
jgi:hypothetical protein